MPVMQYSISELLRLSGCRLEKETLLSTISMLGADVGAVYEDGDKVDIEFFPNRPDLYSIEGLARQLRSYLVEPGFVMPEVKPSTASLIIDRSVSDIRPYIVGAFVRGVEMDGEKIKSLMDMQEKLHLTFGRKRKKVSIGIHDCSRLVPPFFYKAVLPESVSFVPLASSETMNLKEILLRHDKGKAYAHLLDGFGKYPLLVDSREQVLSFPPIINGTLTTVTENTRELFIDVTGTDLNAVKQTLNMVVASLVYRGGYVETVGVVNPDGTGFISPDFKPSEWKCSLNYCNRLLGTSSTPQEFIKAVERMGFRVSGKSDEGSDTMFTILVPPWRTDIIHQVDFAEDMAIGLGYSNFKGTLPRAITYGCENRREAISDKLRLTMVQLGFAETMGLTLSSTQEQFRAMGFKDEETQGLQAEVSIVENPLSTEHSILRVSVLPTLLRLLSSNKHRDYPQNIFEIGYVVREHKNILQMAAVSASAKASFTNIKSLFEAVLRDAGVFLTLGKENYTIEESQWPFYIPGRNALAVFNIPIPVADKDKDKNKSGCMGTAGRDNTMPQEKRVKIVAGHFGEIHPAVLDEFRLTVPVSALVLEAETLVPYFDIISSLKV
ncbi:MAG: phenylalanine--tRNA ligase subunit beta [Thermoplasmata archaeon]